MWQGVLMLYLAILGLLAAISFQFGLWVGLHFWTIVTVLASVGL